MLAVPAAPLLAALALAVVVLRLLWVLVWSPIPARDTRPASTLIVLGSGGHTTEVLALASALGRPENYRPRCYVVAASDGLGPAKAAECEARLRAREPPGGLAGPVDICVIPRSREVSQPWLSSAVTTASATAAAALAVLRRRPRLVLCNGPGTCVPVVAAAVVFRVLGLMAPTVVYVESVARTASLSLTGKLLYHGRLTGAFFVQWPGLVASYPRARYVGRLM